MPSVTLRPNANGDLIQWEGQYPASGPPWDKVDEEIADEDATTIQTSWPNSGKIDMFRLPAAPPIGGISGITVYARARRGVFTAYINIGIRVAGINDFGPNEFLGSSYNTIPKNWATNPNTGAAWTLSDINALQIGVRGDPGSGAILCTQIYVVVTYTIIAPTATTDPATLIAHDGATPNGTLVNDGGEACNCGFEWGETPAYGNTTPTQSRTTGQTFAQAISGLDPNKTYHFRAFATNSAGTGYGADRTFTTLSNVIVVTTNPATAMSSMAATINGLLNDDGGETCQCGFEWGKSVAYGSTTPTQSKNTGQGFSEILAPLDPDTEYHFRAFAINSTGVGYGADRSFRTYPAMSQGYNLERREL